MKIAPNLTILEGRVRSFQKAADGWGGDLKFEVIRNLSDPAARDFIKPAPGQALVLFTSKAPEFDPSRIYRVEAVFNGDHAGGRIVLKSLQAAAPPDSGP